MNPRLKPALQKDTSENYQEGLLNCIKKIRPGEPLSVESADSLINAMFFDPRRYDLAKVGRYKFNKKLLLRKPYPRTNWLRMLWIPDNR